MPGKRRGGAPPEPGFRESRFTQPAASTMVVGKYDHETGEIEPFAPEELNERHALSVGLHEQRRRRRSNR